MATVQFTKEAAVSPLPSLLIIEDEPLQSAVIGRIAGTVGFESVVARTVGDAAALLQAIPFDCITLDLSLRGEHGADLLRLLGDLRYQAPIMIVSGATGLQLELTTSIARSHKLNVRDPMPKPIHADELRKEFARIRADLRAKPAARVAG